MDATAFGQPLVIGKTLDDGFVPLEVICVVKGLDSDGKTSIMWTATQNLETWEALGMVMYAADTLRAEMQRCTCGDEDHE